MDAKGRGFSNRHNHEKNNREVMNTIGTDYVVLSRREYTASDISVRPVNRGDIESIRQWRNSQMDVLRQVSEISAPQQEQYFENYVWPEKQKDRPSQILFSILRRGRVVGYGGLTNISWPDSRGEVSFLLDPESERDMEIKEQVFSPFLRILSEISFRDLGLAKIFCETFSLRPDHIEILEANGFVHEGTLRDHITLGNSRFNSLIHGLLASEWTA